MARLLNIRLAIKGSGRCAGLCLLLLTTSIAWAEAPPVKPDAGAGAAIVARAVEAMGGAALVDRIVTLTVVGNATRETPNGTLKSPTRTYIEFPASFRQEIEINGTMIAMASSPQGAFLIAPSRVQALSEAQRQNLEVTALHNPLVMLKGRRQELFSADAKGESAIDGTAVDLVDIFVGNEQLQIAVEKSSGRILRQEFDTRGGTPDRPGRMVVNYSDFRRTPYGITIPHTSIGRFEGTIAFQSSIQSVTVNAKLKESLFNPGAFDPETRPPAPAIK